MTNDQRVPVRTGWARAALAGLVLVLGLITLPSSAWAVSCPPPDLTTDTDKDGFTDAQECNGIMTLGTTPKFFPPCGVPVSGVLPHREDCVDPNSKDVFVIYNPAAAGSLLTALPNPFAALEFSCGASSWCGALGVVRFTGLSTLGITVHQLTTTQAATTRLVTAVSTQKAVRVSESLDVSSVDILGNCQWGLPTGLDSCAVYTQRAMNFINSKCNLAQDTTTDRNQVFLAYATFLVIHEAGHSLGGLAAKYDAAFGGYHYPTTSGFVMSQAAQYDTLAGRCRWYIPSTWNPTLDPAGVKLIK